MKKWLFALWISLGVRFFNKSVEEFKYDAYDYWIKFQAGAADRLGITEDFKFGNDDGYRLHEANKKNKKKIRLEDTMPNRIQGIPILGNPTDPVVPEMSDSEIEKILNKQKIAERRKLIV